MIKVAIVDDHQLILKGLTEMLKTAENLQVIEVFKDGESFLEFIKTTENRPNVILLDINLPGVNGLDICKEVTTTFNDVKIIALTNYNETSFVKSMIRNGAKGYLLKNCSQKELTDSIKEVYEGNTYLPQEIQDQLLMESLGEKVSTSFMPRLTRREKEVLTEIAREKTNFEISKELFISIKTVETHRNNLLQKFRVKNTAGLIKKALLKGYIS